MQRVKRFFVHLSEQIGNRLREERVRLDLSQETIAQRIGVRREMWSRYEAGSEPGAVVLAAIGAAGIDVRYVITGSRDYKPLPDEELALLKRWRKASDEVKHAAMGALLGGTARAVVKQTIKGSVGQLTSGDAHITIGSYQVHDERKPYGPASKARAVKPPKKP